MSENKNEDIDELILRVESNIDDSCDINLNIGSQSWKVFSFEFKSDKIKNKNAKITRKRWFKIKIKIRIYQIIAKVT